MGELFDRLARIKDSTILYTGGAVAWGTVLAMIAYDPRPVYDLVNHIRTEESVSEGVEPEFEQRKPDFEDNKYTLTQATYRER